MRDKDTNDIGINRTGMGLAPSLGRAMVESSHDEVMPVGEEGEVDGVRLDYAREAPLVGTMPPPATVKGIGTAAVGMVKGDKANVLLDKLGARAAFERGGTRIYDALLAKLQVAPAEDGGPTLEEVREIRDEEMRHFVLVSRAIEALGGDPTVQTPSADLEGVAAMGIVQVVTDPRTGVRECLQAILNAELADAEAWDTLVALTERFGQGEMADEFRGALANEERHLARVRDWLDALVEGEAFGEARAERPPARKKSVRKPRKRSKRS